MRSALTSRDPFLAEEMHSNDHRPQSRRGSCEPLKGLRKIHIGRARAGLHPTHSQLVLSDLLFRLRRCVGSRQCAACGSAGNRQLTALVAAILVLLLAIEGATLLRLGSLLTVHAFVGMLLIPIVALKLASTGWRILRYYLGADGYTRHGPPPPCAVACLVAPVFERLDGRAPRDRCRAARPRSDRRNSCRPAQVQLHRLAGRSGRPRAGPRLEAASPLANSSCRGWAPCSSRRGCRRSRMRCRGRDTSGGRPATGPRFSSRPPRPRRRTRCCA